MTIIILGWGCHLVPAVYSAGPQGRVLGPGQRWGSACPPEAEKPRGHLGAKAVLEGECGCSGNLEGPS